MNSLGTFFNLIITFFIYFLGVSSNPSTSGQDMEFIDPMSIDVLSFFTKSNPGSIKNDSRKSENYAISSGKSFKSEQSNNLTLQNFSLPNL